MSGRFRRAAAAGGVALAVAMTAGQGQAAFPGQSGLIAFQSNRDTPFNGAEVYVMNPNGTGQKRLTTAGGGQPAWSPDGSKIAFVSARDGNGEVYVMNADGSNQTRVTTTPSESELSPSWSPDGTKLLFARFSGSNYDIYVSNLDGSGDTNLTNSPAEDIYPVWHPDGTKIAFQSNRDGNTEIYTMQPDGSNPTNISNRPATPDEQPDWSPDGTRLLFTSVVNFAAQVFVMNADGSNPVSITTNPQGNHMPAWSPDGTKIAFTSFRDFNDEIYVMNADGSGAIRLTNNAPPGSTLPEDFFADWQPLASPPPVNLPPLVSAGGPYSGTEGGAVAIGGSATDPEGDALMARWTATPNPGTNFGASCTFVGQGSVSASVSCTDDGVFTLTLSVEDGQNLPVSATATLTLANAGPTVTITSPTDGASFPIGQPVSFSATINDPGTSDPQRCSINWGDGNTTQGFISSRLCSATNTYFSPGSRTIIVTVNDEDSATASDSVTITLLQASLPPTGSAGCCYQGIEGSPVAIAGTASDPDGDPLIVSWRAEPLIFGFSMPGAPTPSCSFENPNALATTVTCNDNVTGGFFLLTLTISDGRTPPVSVQANLGIQNASPPVNITSPANGSTYLPGEPLTVTASINDPGANDTHTCRINWGDGSPTPPGEAIDNGVCSATHTYTSGGPKTISVTVTDDDGGVGGDTIFVDAPLNAPPNGSASGGVGTEGSAIEISGTASDPDGDPVSTSWEAVPLLNTDPGAQCTFADLSSLTTTATCNDNGIYMLVLRLRDGVTGEVTATSTLTVSNATPAVTITAPAEGTSVPAGSGFGGFNVAAQITDAGANDTFICFIRWGDDTESKGSVVDDTCSAGHVYTTYGPHTVNVFVSDDDEESAGDSIMITVTDELIKVTGEGTIDANTSFSLAARGSGELNTNGQLQVRTGRNRFDGNIVDNVILNSPNSVSWSGSGRFNGQGGYTFKATVVDNSTGSGTNKPPDMISLLIRSSSGAVVFATNGPVPLKSGNILVHG